MTYLIRRGSTWHFRYRLPDDLKGREAPPRLPESLKKLVNGKTRRFKHELTESLRTRENSKARIMGGILIADSELLVSDLRRFLTEGAPRSLSSDVIEYLAEKRVHELLATDDRIRRSGLGLNLEPLQNRLSIPKNTEPSGSCSAPGMTLDDLELLRFTTDKASESLKMGVALRQAPSWVKAEVYRALNDRGVELEPDSEERHNVEVAFLAASQRALDAIQRRNSGLLTPTPETPSDPTERLGPYLSAAFTAWSDGTLLPGMKAPRPRSSAEAEFVVRRFIELHGDVRVGAITREHPPQ